MTLSNLPYAALLALALSAVTPAAPLAQPLPPPAAQIPAGAWPRQVNLSHAAALIYQPQVTRWEDNRIAFRCALAIKANDASAEAFGVVFATATTHVDKVGRTVALDNLTVTKSDFPSLPDRGAAYAAELQAAFGAGVRTVALDRLKMSLAATGNVPPSVAVDNTPPRVIVAYAPAILVPIDGPPVLQPVAGVGGFQRVINTRALIVKSASAPQFFIHVYDGWLMAPSMDGPWTQPFIAPAGIDAVAKKFAASGVVDLLDGGPGAAPKPTLARGIPTIHTTQVPAELIVFKGQPDFVPIVGTQLRWAANTRSDVLQDASSNDFYALLSGRWFRSSALTGPWTFVAGTALPPDFARIPATSLAGAVLPTVAGTPQAQEAVSENAIPQTATVSLKNGPKFAAVFDGAPQFAPIPGTSLAFATNAAVPVIQAAGNAYYAVAAGVWFTAAQPTGPWTIATSVPDAIYAIPPSSSIFYATFVRIYGARGDTVSMGYTPGYLGALVTPAGTVVYGTGYAYPSAIGTQWYPAPSTYGVAAVPVHDQALGYGYRFALGLASTAPTGGNRAGANVRPGFGSSDPCCASTYADVYLAWGSAATSKPRAGEATRAASGAAAATGAANRQATSQPAQGSNPSYISANAYYASLGQSSTWNGNTVADNHYADESGNVYRSSGSGGGWQQQTPDGWSNVPAAPPAVDAQAQARSRADEAALQAGSYSISNATRFSGDRGDGWTAQDAGDGGYSRTLGGSGGIGAEVYNYNQAVLSNEITMWNDQVFGGDYLYYGGIGWGGRFGAP
jgi:hypothetical protein